MATHPRQFPDDPKASEDAIRRSGPHPGWTDDDELETVWYVAALQRWLVVILLVAVVAGGVGFWYAGMQPLGYEGVTTLLVVPPSQATGALAVAGA